MTESAADRMVLFMFPAACSRVTMSAFEEAGLDYEERLVNIFTNQQKSPDYLSLNPKAKVPALVNGGKVMTENAAILWFTHQLHPEAHLLPRTGDAIDDNQGLSDLAWCAGVLHPMVRQVRAPAKYTTGDPAGIHADGLVKFAHECEMIAGRVSGGRWWYGAAWSIVDVYLYWTYSTAEKGGFPLSDYPDLVDHAARVRARPSFQRALEREEAMVALHRAKLPADIKL